MYGMVYMHFNFDSFFLIILLKAVDAKRFGFSVSESIVLWYFYVYLGISVTGDM